MKLKIKLIILLSTLTTILINVNICLAQSDNSYITPNVGTHPRVLITSGDLPKLKNKFNSSNFKIPKNEIIKNSTIYLYNNDEDSLIKSIEANAFLYLINNDTNKGFKSIELLHKALGTNSQFNSSNSASRLTFSLSLVYDWCYSLLSTSQRETLANEVKNLTSKTELNYPIDYESSLTGHSSGDLLLKNLLAASIAIYDEDDTIYNDISTDINEKFIPSREFIYNSGAHHQGTNYGSARFECELMSSILLSKIGYRSPYGKNQLTIPLNWIYELRGDGRFLTDGDTFDGEYTSPLNYIITAGLTKNPYLANMASRYDKYYIDEPILYMLFFDPTVKKTPLNSLPLTKYFSSPIGKMVSRTGWDEGKNSNSVVAEMKIGEYNFANHSHLDSGSFQIYYKGALAIDSGVYEGNRGGYNSEHYKNYYKRTIAHNSMLISDPNEKFTYEGGEVQNDGGQRFPNKGNEASDLDQLNSGGYKTGKVLGNWFGPDSKKPVFSYLKGDITDAYSSKVAKYTRTFVFINNMNKKIPASMIIFDKIASKDANMKKTWLLHSMEKPEYNNPNIVITRKNEGYNGKLINTVLLPESRSSSVDIIGGFGKEFIVNGKNYPNISNEKEVDAGSYRVELSNSRIEKSSQFLNVMQMSDSTNSDIYKVEKSDISKNILKINISNNSVLFSKDDSKIKEPFSFKNKKSSANIDFLITDLTDGTWQVFADNKLIVSKVVNNKSPVITFKSKSKEILIKRSDKVNKFKQILTLLKSYKDKYLSDLIGFKFHLRIFFMNIN